MSKTKVEKLSEEKLNAMEVKNWGIWTSEVKKFPWEYSETEKCYILEGHVVVTEDSGETVEIKKGDFVTFPKGLKCTWDVKEPIRKHYQFEE